MRFKKNICVNCHYEDANKTEIDREHNGISVWCNFYSRFINDDDRQGVKPRNDGTYEDNVWCSNFKPCE